MSAAALSVENVPGDLIERREKAMKVLVATADTQQERSTDYHWATEGELVWIQEPCRRDRERMPNPCECGRAFAGLASHQATTTAKVIDLPALDLAGYESAIATSLADGGWSPDAARGIAKVQSEFAAEWEAETVLERDLWLFTARRGGALDAQLLSVDEYLDAIFPGPISAMVADSVVNPG
jgi:hypothetical protein